MPVEIIRKPLEYGKRPEAWDRLTRFESFHVRPYQASSLRSSSGKVRALESFVYNFDKILEIWDDQG